ncbi:hypothetical protein TRFO_04061 [Tritrichomonas foetus]|uniref:Bromodomain containing protein n=1 Tax=Tritrichomonas foetus TaxID=1144522 RepID=A0A1J4KIP5_9EUKA|nr:hypothetical protein TRFO_04061 [Tritrichomonas foetus]|eukprot:OHT11107.1 hypothetical protein TRFO_04061 [Tritrichomonas foetus]
MYPTIKFRVVNIMQKVFSRPIGKYFLSMIPNYLNNSRIQERYDKIFTKLEDYQYSSFEEWHCELTEFITDISRNCGHDYVSVCDTIIQLIDDETKGSLNLTYDEMAQQFICLIKNFAPNSRLDFYQEREVSNPDIAPVLAPPPPPPMNSNDILNIQDRLQNLDSSRQKSLVSQLVLTKNINKAGITQIKGGISFTIDSLPLHTLQIVKNHLENLEQEQNNDEGNSELQ